jgi:hypothetical protein
LFAATWFAEPVGKSERCARSGDAADRNVRPPR